VRVEISPSRYVNERLSRGEMYGCAPLSKKLLTEFAATMMFVTRSHGEPTKRLVWVPMIFHFE